jgi:hypothetical protein
VDLHLSHPPPDQIDDEAPLEEVSFSLRDGHLLAQTFVAGEGEQPTEGWRQPSSRPRRSGICSIGDGPAERIEPIALVSGTSGSSVTS